MDRCWGNSAKRHRRKWHFIYSNTTGFSTKATADVARMNRQGIAQKTSLSILIPAHNEAAGLARLLPEIQAMLAGWKHAPVVEIIVVDDGSSDDTAAVVVRLAEFDSRFRCVSLARQSGQSTALVAAVSIAMGDWLATLDADGQNDPADIPLLWEEARRGQLQAVLGWRRNRQDNCRTRWVSRVANRVRNRVLGQSIIDTGCSTRLIKATAMARLPRFEGWHRFLGPMLVASGAKISQVPVNHRPRENGRSHYNWRNRGLRVVADLFGVAWLNRRMIKVSPEKAVDKSPRLRFDSAHELMNERGKTGSIGLSAELVENHKKETFQR